MTDSVVRLVFLGDASQAVRSVKTLDSSVSGLGRTAHLAAAAVGIGLVSAFGEAVHVAIQFDKEMRNVNSIAKLNERQFQQLSTQVRGLAKETAQGPETLAKGLYDIVSSGFKASDGLKILKASAIAATAGLTDTATSTKAVVAILNAYHLSADKAKNVSSLLFTEVQDGVNTFQELAQNIGDTAPLAAALKIPFSQVAAGLALITLHGTPMAEAATQMSRVMADLLKPSKGLAKELHSLGFESGQAAIEQKGFVGVIKLLSNAANGSSQATADWFHNIRSLRGMLNLTGPNLKLFNQFADDMAKSFQKGGADIAAFNEQSKSISVQWQKASAELQAALIPVGQLLFPLLEKGASEVGMFAGEVGKHMPEIRNDFQEAGQAAQTLARDVETIVAPVAHLVQGLGVANVAVSAFAAVAGYKAAAAAIQLGQSFRTLVQNAVAAQVALQATTAAAATTGVVQAAVQWEQVGGAMVATTGKAEQVAGAAARAGSSVSKIGVAGSVAMGALGGPVGIATLAVAGLSGAFVYAWMKSRELSGGLKELHDALENTKAAADDLAHANLGLVAAKANVATASLQVTVAEHQAATAIKQSGAHSDEARLAADNLRQARVHLSQATQDEKDAEHAAAAAHQRSNETARQLTEGYYRAAGAAQEHAKRLASENQLMHDAPGAAGAARNAMDGVKGSTDKAKIAAEFFIGEMSKLEGHLKTGDTDARNFAQAARLLAEMLGRIPSTKEIKIYMRTIGSAPTGYQTYKQTTGTSRAVGGFIPGANGKAVPVLAHAGEAILNQAQVQQLGGPTALARMFGWSGDQGPSFAVGGIVGGLPSILATGGGDPGGNVTSDAGGRKPPPPRHKHPRTTPHKRLAKAVARGEAETAGIAKEIEELDLQKQILDQEYNFAAEEFDLANRNLDYILTDPTSGIESLNSGAVGTRTNQIHVLQGQRTDVQRTLESEMTRVKEMIALLQRLIPEIQAQIAELKRKIAEETKRINDDVAKIRKLQDQIAAERRAIADERAKKGTREYVIDPLTGKRVIRTVGGPDKSKIDAMEGTVRKLEGEKTATERDKSDTIHKREVDRSQMSKLTEKLSKFKTQEDEQNVNAQLTLPGAENEVQFDLDKLAAELVDLNTLPAQIATYNKQLADGQVGGDFGGGGDLGSTDFGGGSTPADNSDLIRQVGALKLALAIQNAQLPIIGAYQRGALHVSESGLAMLHAGEEVRQSNKVGGLGGGDANHSLTLHLAPTDELGRFVEVRVADASERLNVKDGRATDRRRREGRF